MFKKALVWSLIVGIPHPSLTEEDQRFRTSIPILKQLFPGICDKCMTGVACSMSTYGIPALKKLFPELETMNAEEILAFETVDIVDHVLPTIGDEWETSSKWQEQFKQLMVA